MSRLIAVVPVAAALAAAGPAAAEDVARAHGVGAVLPAGNAASATATSGGVEERTARAAGLRGTLGDIGSVTVRLTAGGDPGVAEGRVVATDVLLLGGRVTASEIVMTVRAEADGSAVITEAVANGLTVDGVAYAPAPGERIEIGGVGAVVLFEQVGDGTGSVRANALRIEVNEPGAGEPTAAAVVVGHLDATAVPGEEPAPAPGGGSDTPPAGGTTAAPPATTTPPPAASGGSDASGGSSPGTTSPAPVTSTPAPSAYTPSRVPALTPQVQVPTTSATPGITPTSDGYVFPVFGDVSFTDDYGAPRAGTGWHQGNDLFADTGTPLLAVADGTLDRVGVNTLGGNRLWLTDTAGNKFYYAHLSAYAPGTVNGARVRAGQVIGFVGNTGQAITTPPHLHFEIHPGGGDSVNPYPYLVAWQRGAPVARAFRAAEQTTGSAPAPAAGAVLVAVEPAQDVPSSAADAPAVPVR